MSIQKSKALLLAIGFALTTLLLLVAFATRADVVCTAGPLSRFHPTSAAPPKFLPGHSSSLDVSELPRKLVVAENYGYTLYTLSNPAAPAVETVCDLESFYNKAGDGFSTVFSVGISQDASRLTVGYQEPHGTLLLGRQGGKPFCGGFAFSGEWAPARVRSEAVVGTTAFSLANAGSVGIWAAPAGTLVTGAAAQKPNSIKAVPVLGSPAGDAGSLTAVGGILLYHTVGSVVVVDGGKPPLVVPAGALGFPASDEIRSVVGAPDPARKSGLSVLVEATSGYRLCAYDAGHLTVASKLIPFTWGDTSPGVAAAVRTDTGVLFFAWRHQGTPAANALVTLASGNPYADLTPSAVYPATQQFPGATAMRAMRVGATVYLYTTTAEAAYVLPVACH